MSLLKEYLIPFVGLKLGKHQYDYQLDNNFFAAFEYTEYNSCKIKVSVVLNKKSSHLELAFKHKGTVNVACDKTNENFDLPIKGKLNLIVKFGDTFNDENEELLILPHGEFQINISQYIYEMVILSVPFKRIHPGIKDGTLQTDALKKLEELTPREIKIEKENTTDPRWENLKKLLTDK